MAKILVCEDEEITRYLIRDTLRPLGYRVEFARDGKEAIDKVKEIEPDLILLDIKMPGIDGFEVAKSIKQSERTRIIPVLIVSVLTDSESKVKAFNEGADDFLTKPFDPIELRARVESLLKVKAYNDHMRNYQKELEKEVARRSKQLKKALYQLRKASLDTIYRLSMAAEYRDDETGAHVKRMSHYSAVIAREMGLSSQVSERLLLAAPMHDVGKIGIPDQILLKPERLSPSESEIMKQHTIIGSKILAGSKSGYLRFAEIIALTHHEWWNGNGYPRGLKGNQIPIAGQIVAVADVFDALISKRPYKEPYPVDMAFKIIKEEAGTHLSPKVVNAFFKVKDQILKIKERFKEESESLLIQTIKKIDSSVY